MWFLREFLLGAVAYLLGSFATGYYLVRRCTGHDLREEGSGSTGASNAARLLGWRGFLATLAGDVVKGALAVSMARLLNAGATGEGIAACAVVAGHLWPPQLEWRGGKGAAPAMGALLLLDSWLLAQVLIVFAAAWCVFRSRAPAGLLGATAAPFLALAQHRPTAPAVSVLVVLVLVGHRANLLSYLRRPRREDNGHGMRAGL